MNTLQAWIDALAGTLVHSLWQGSVVAVLLAALLAICPRSRPEWRCRMAMLALSALGAWMVLTFCQALPVEGGRAGTSTSLSSAAAVGTTTSGTLESAAVAPVTTVMWRIFIVTSWLVGAGFCGLRLMGGAFGLVTLRRQSVDVAAFDILRSFDKVRRRVGVKQQVMLRISERIDSPLTFGWLRPVILVPASLLSALPITHMEAIFAHELMHVRRADYLFNLLFSVFRSAMFYHPAVWWMAKVVETEREMTCDLGAVKSLRSTASGYASALLAIDEWRDACRRGLIESAPLAMSMRAGDGLLARVERLALARQRGSISSPLNVPVMMIFVLASISVMAGLQLAGTGNNSSSGSGVIERILIDPPFVCGKTDMEIALQIIKQPRAWPLPAAEGRLMRSPLVLAVNGVARPFGKNDPPVFGDIPNAWILKYGLNYLDAGVCDRDLDRDGFSAAEEFAADTSPVDATSRPPLIDKLRFVERKQQLYRVEFAAQPDRNTFQINRLPSARWSKKTMLLSLAETSEDGQIELLGSDDGILSVRFQETGKIYRLGKGERADLSVDFALMDLNIGSGESYTIRVGDSFVIGGEDESWTLQSVDESSATVRGSEEKKLVRLEATSSVAK